MDPEQTSSIRRHVTRKNLTIAASLCVVAILSFSGGLFYPQLTSQLNLYGSPLKIEGYSGLIVDYVTVNGPAINGGFYQSSCCPDSICSGLSAYGLDRLDALNQQNPPEIACGFQIGANTSGFLEVIVFNTDWDATYVASFTTSSSDKTVAFVSMPDCGNSCIVGPLATQWFKFGFAASVNHDSAQYVTLSITVKAYI